MGCTSSVYAIAKTTKKKRTIQQVSIFVPSLHIPVHSDIQRSLKGLIPKDLAQRISSLRNQIALLAQDTGGSAINELQNALEDYLSLLLGLTNKENQIQQVVEFKWKELEDNRKETCAVNSSFELLCVLYMMSVLTLTDADLKLFPKNTNLSERLVSPDCMREAIDLLLKAAGHLNFCVRDVILRLPPDIRKKMPLDMHESVLEAISNQALAQGTELQLGLAVGSQNATLSVKRRLACEQLSFLEQAHCCLSEVNNNGASGKKQVLFIKWKFLEAKAAAYYYHGSILDKGSEPSSQVSAVSCFFAAQELLVESKKACLTFCLSDPITRATPPWGAMKYLHKKIPETANMKSQMYGYLLEQEKGLQILPDLPEFQLSLKPDDYVLPEVDPAWDGEEWEITGQTLKEHLNDKEGEEEKEI